MVDCPRAVQPPRADRSRCCLASRIKAPAPSNRRAATESSASMVRVQLPSRRRHWPAFRITVCDRESISPRGEKGILCPCPLTSSAGGKDQHAEIGKTHGALTNSHLERGRPAGPDAAKIAANLR